MPPTSAQLEPDRVHQGGIFEAEVLTDQRFGVVDEGSLLLVVEAEPGEVGIAGHLGDGAIECGERRLEGAAGRGLLEEELERAVHQGALRRPR